MTDSSGLGCTLSDGEVYGVAGIGVTLVGGRHRTLTPGANTVRNTSIHHFSRWHRSGPPRGS